MGSADAPADPISPSTSTPELSTRWNMRNIPDAHNYPLHALFRDSDKQHEAEIAKYGTTALYRLAHQFKLIIHICAGQNSLAKYYFAEATETPPPHLTSRFHYREKGIKHLTLDLLKKWVKEDFKAYLSEIYACHFCQIARA